VAASKPIVVDEYIGLQFTLSQFLQHTRAAGFVRKVSPDLKWLRGALFIVAVNYHTGALFLEGLCYYASCSPV
jgi:hypothetical protein